MLSTFLNWCARRDLENSLLVAFLVLTIINFIGILQAHPIWLSEGLK